MKLFTNLVTLAVFLVGIYQTVSVVDGKAVVNVGGSDLMFEMKVGPPSQAGISADDSPARQEKSQPKAILITPVPDAKSVSPSNSGR